MSDIPTACPDCGAGVNADDKGVLSVFSHRAECGRFWESHRGWRFRPITCYERQIARLRAENERLRLIEDAIDNSGLDISPCRGCGEPVVCLPDGMSDWCAECADAAKLAMADLLKHDPVVNAAAQAVMDADGVVFDPEEGDK